MKEPEIQVVRLEDKCPNCGSELFSFWHTPSTDHPECGNWYVQCTSNVCDYLYDDTYPNLDYLKEDYRIKN